tara:strand:+ start:771 stop:926 length:156 start_codon:yes stop_codon:yes gene_type:complete
VFDGLKQVGEMTEWRIEFQFEPGGPRFVFPFQFDSDSIVPTSSLSLKQKLV